MSSIRENIQYTKTHEWVKDNGDGTYTLGITDNAQEQLGDMVFVELPTIGESFVAKSNLCTVESVKAASDVYAPVDLEVVAVNTKLDNSPELINQSCYDEGYLLVFKSVSISGLLDANTYRRILNKSQ